MSKYSFEFKKKVVDEFIAGVGGYRYLANKYNIPSKSSLRIWVNNYKAFGYEGLKPSSKHKSFTFDFKLYIVELYLLGSISYQQLALLFGINNPSLIVRWVNDFRRAGPDALKNKKRGCKKLLETNNNQEQSDPKSTNVSTDANLEKIKELEKQLLYARIENAYLKELRRLRLEEEELLNKQRGLSTASDKTLD